MSEGKERIMEESKTDALPENGGDQNIDYQAKYNELDQKYQKFTGEIGTRLDKLTRENEELKAFREKFNTTPNNEDYTPEQLEELSYNPELLRGFITKETSKAVDSLVTQKMSERELNDKLQNVFRPHAEKVYKDFGIDQDSVKQQQVIDYLKDANLWNNKIQPLHLDLAMANLFPEKYAELQTVKYQNAALEKLQKAESDTSGATARELNLTKAGISIDKLKDPSYVDSLTIEQLEVAQEYERANRK